MNSFSLAISSLAAARPQALLRSHTLHLGQIAVLFAAIPVHDADIGTGLIDETRAPILRENFRIVDGNDILERFAIIQLADTLCCAQLVAVGRTRIVEKSRGVVARCL